MGKREERYGMENECLVYVWLASPVVRVVLWFLTGKNVPSSHMEVDLVQRGGHGHPLTPLSDVLCLRDTKTVSHPCGHRMSQETSIIYVFVQRS